MAFVIKTIGADGQVKRKETIHQIDDGCYSVMIETPAGPAAASKEQVGELVFYCRKAVVEARVGGAIDLKTSVIVALADRLATAERDNGVLSLQMSDLESECAGVEMERDELRRALDGARELLESVALGGGVLTIAQAERWLAKHPKETPSVPGEPIRQVLVCEHCGRALAPGDQGGPKCYGSREVHGCGTVAGKLVDAHGETKGGG